MEQLRLPPGTGFTKAKRLGRFLSSVEYEMEHQVLYPRVRVGGEI